jgi:hypothetical protein
MSCIKRKTTNAPGMTSGRFALAFAKRIGMNNQITQAIAAVWASQRIKEEFLTVSNRLKEAGVLEALVEWSEAQPRLAFIELKGNSGTDRIDLVKYRLLGLKSPFWTAWPEGKYGPKVSLLTGLGQDYHETVRKFAREELNRIFLCEQGKSPELPLSLLLKTDRMKCFTDLMEAILSRLP